MQLVINSDSASFEFRVKLSEFPYLVNAHLANVLHTKLCENLGAEVLASNFEWKCLEEFIRTVCRWGGFAGVGGRVIKNNSRELIVESFSPAKNAMLQDKPRLDSSLREINKIKGLGTPSFASKHLRFLWPRFCPVLDSRMLKLGYDFTPEGYSKFGHDCEKLAQSLMEKGIANPVKRSDEQWFVSEIDMALFAQLSGWQENVGTGSP